MSAVRRAPASIAKNLTRPGVAKNLVKGGVGAIAADLALGYAEDKLKETGHEKIGAVTGIGKDALSWGATGAMLGSIVPGVGTAVGGAVGATAGGLYGLYRNADELFSSKKQEPSIKLQDVREFKSNNNIDFKPLTDYLDRAFNNLNTPLTNIQNVLEVIAKKDNTTNLTELTPPAYSMPQSNSFTNPRSFGINTSIESLRQDIRDSRYSFGAP
jgi:phage tail tape-measure protein